jgi:hypothetical protein
LSGETCPAGEGFDGTSCQNITALSAGNAVNQTAKPQQVLLFSFVVAPATKGATISIDSFGKTTTFKTWLRLSGVPSANAFDFSGDAVVSAPQPLPGTWYAAVQLTGDTDTVFSVKLDASTCPQGQYGVNCITPLSTDASKLVSSPAVSPGNLVYFTANTNPLWISFQSSNDKITFKVYGAIGNIPDSKNHIVQGCNQPNCRAVTSIKLDNSTNTLNGNETWIFAVTPVENTTTIGAWVSSICAPTCDSPSGECTDEGPDTGYCSCEESYTGIDCSIVNGLPSQYIVLIIIAALVIASAVIGFIAWAYMRRRRRVHYEKVV